MPKSMTRLALLPLALALSFALAGAQEPGPPPEFRLVIAITDPTSSPPSTVLSLLDPLTGARQDLYRDQAEAAERLLVHIGGSDVLHTVRALPPADLYAVRGPARVEVTPPPAAPDSLARLRLGSAAPAWERLLPLPLSFSDASPYGLWNRAPVFAVSPDGRRVAFPALRAGEERFPQLTIRVLSLAGEEERRIALPERGRFAVNDLVFLPDGKHLAYALVPEGDEHTLDETLLPKAGVYLAEVDRPSSLLLHQCYPDALAWSPLTGMLAVAVRPRDFWDTANVVRVIDPAEGARREELSAPGFVQALAYSSDGGWLAVQTSSSEGQRISVYPAEEGFARDVYLLPPGAGRLALVGWVQLPKGEG